MSDNFNLMDQMETTDKMKYQDELHLEETTAAQKTLSKNARPIELNPNAQLQQHNHEKLQGTRLKDYNAVKENIKAIKLKSYDEEVEEIANSSQVVNMGAKKRKFRSKLAFSELKEKKDNLLNLQKATQMIKEYNIEEDFGTTSKQAKLLYEEFMSISFEKVDLTSDKALVQNAKWFESLSFKTQQMDSLIGRYPEICPGEERSAFNNQMNAASRISSYYLIKKELILDPYYAKMYNKELPYRSKDNMSAKDREIQKKLWMAEACLNGLSRERMDFYDTNVADTANESLNSYLSSNKQMIDGGAIGELGKQDFEIRASANAQYFKDMRAAAELSDTEEKKLDENQKELLRKYNVLTTIEGGKYCISGTDYKMSENFTRNIENLANVKFIKEMDPEELKQMIDNLTARPSEAMDVATCKGKNMAGVRRFKDLLMDHTRYLNQKYGVGLANLSHEEYLANKESLIEDFVNGQGLEAFLNMCRSIPGMMSAEDLKLADDFTFHRMMAQIQGFLPGVIADKKKKLDALEDPEDESQLSMTEIVKTGVDNIVMITGLPLNYIRHMKQAGKNAPIDWNKKLDLKDSKGIAKSQRRNAEKAKEKEQLKYQAKLKELHSRIEEKEIHIREFQAEMKKNNDIINDKEQSKRQIEEAKERYTIAEVAIQKSKKEIEINKKIEDGIRHDLENKVLESEMEPALIEANKSQSFLHKLPKGSPLKEAMKSFTKYNKAFISSDTEFLDAVKGYAELKEAINSSSDKLSSEDRQIALELLENRGQHIISEVSRISGKINFISANPEELKDFQLPESRSEFEQRLGPMIKRYNSAYDVRELLTGQVDSRKIFSTTGNTIRENGHPDFQVSKDDYRMLPTFNIELLKEDGSIDVSENRLKQVTQNYVNCCQGSEQERIEASKKHIIEVDEKINSFTERMMSDFGVSVNEKGEIVNPPTVDKEFVQKNYSKLVTYQSISADLASLLEFENGTHAIGDLTYNKETMVAEMKKLHNHFVRLRYNFDVLASIFSPGISEMCMKYGLNTTDLNPSNDTLDNYNEAATEVMIESNKMGVMLNLQASYQEYKGLNSQA